MDRRTGLLAIAVLIVLVVLAAVFLLFLVSPSPSPLASPSPTLTMPAPRPVTAASPTSPPSTSAHPPRPTPWPTPTFYVTLYPYSLDSLEGWSFYTDTQLKIAFPYPAQPPRIDYSERLQATFITIQAHWDSTNPRAHANIVIMVWKCSDHVPLKACVADMAQRDTGSPDGYGQIVDLFVDQDLVEALKRAGAEEVVVFAPMGNPTYFARYREQVFAFNQGYESWSEAQYRIFQLIINNIRFLP